MQKHTSTINRLERDPAKFDVLDLFDAIGRDRKFVLNNEKDETAFIDAISKSLFANKTSTMIYGRRVESMFAYIASSLGKLTLIKKEDCGDTFCGNGIKIPDYRVVFNDGKQLFVEVKNYHQKATFNNYSMKTTYLEGLLRYAALMKIDLRIAIYWSKWNVWTLLDPKDFKRDGSKATIPFTTAMERNEMIVLGDYVVGTTPPLSLRLYPDENNPYSISNNMAEFVIGSVELLCNNTSITVENEQRIAFALMLYGNWAENKISITLPNSENEVEYIEFSYSPMEYDDQQGFCMIGTLSTIISRQYGQLTAPDGKVERLSPNVDPGMLGFIIPEDYKGTSLPLWRFHMNPNDK